MHQQKAQPGRQVRFLQQVLFDGQGYVEHGRGQVGQQRGILPAHFEQIQVFAGVPRIGVYQAFYSPKDQLNLIGALFVFG